MTLSLRQLRYFVAIADAGAFARAAEALNIAQSALSHHVSEIETELGVSLLNRRPRGIVLTPAGRRLYEHAGAILSAMTKAEFDVKTFTEVASGPVAVGLTHTAAAVSALPLMKIVGANCPNVHLTISEGLSPHLTERVLSGVLDLALAFNPSNDARLERAPILREELFLVGRPEVIGKSSSPVRFADIPQGAVLGLTPPTSRAILQTQFLRSQIKPSPTLEIDSLNIMRTALEAGLGCGILARSTVGCDLLRGEVHARRIIEPTLMRDLSLIWLAEHPHTRAFAEVRQMLKDIVLEDVRNGRWPAEILEPEGKRSGKGGENNRRANARSR
ncbi:LysR family transcriptional regulator [Bradyrhizobium sp. DOA9]|uniref:LysR family transcriptional regulator n=1 Tax=Bradyrhizobium sp. DOA9 TaxID=1126627 RepID=UPI00046849D4|nr:LysR family transcriptional regulator [Bradyrhizobium sp. DOA9]GAJ37949.1 nitrogen assimilation regulatory protein nac [Bradyrhizobium sp. DOA9]